MTYLYVVFVLLVAGLFTAGVVEQRRHLAQLNSIEHRVLVNGIRGKSSITRLCAGALRGGGLVTTAKTTGTAARFIHPDGSEEPVYRKWGIANVVEQIGIVRRAAAYRSDVLVIECMAVMPDLQEINQSKLIRSTIGVLCNVREDHLAEMGPTLDDVARSLSRSMPVGGVCVTAERDRLHILEQEAAKRNCELIAVDPESVTDEDMAGFTWVTFKENVAIALKVAELLGVNRRSALDGMWAAPPDPGVLSVQTRAVGDKRIKLANVFAANDPESTLMNIERLLEQGAIARPLHVVVNCRPDRVERNRQMGALIARIDPDRVLLIGEPTRSALSAIDEQWRDRVSDLGGARGPDELLDAVLAGIDSTASLVAIGNIHGQGEVLLEAIEHLDEPPAEDGRPTTTPGGRQPAARAGREPERGPAEPPRAATRAAPPGGHAEPLRNTARPPRAAPPRRPAEPPLPARGDGEPVRPVPPRGTPVDPRPAQPARRPEPPRAAPPEPPRAPAGAPHARQRPVRVRPGDHAYDVRADHAHDASADHRRGAWADHSRDAPAVQARGASPDHPRDAPPDRARHAAADHPGAAQVDHPRGVLAAHARRVPAGHPHDVPAGRVRRTPADHPRDTSAGHARAASAAHARDASAETRFIDPDPRPVRGDLSDTPPHPDRRALGPPRPAPRPPRPPAPDGPGSLPEPPGRQPPARGGPRRPEQRPAPRPPEQP